MVLRWMLPCCSLLALLLVQHANLCSSEMVAPLSRYDDFFRCQSDDYPGEFCFVKVVLGGENHQSFESSRIVVDFRHNLLDWGICVADCQRELADIPGEERQRLFQPKFPINFTYILPNHWGAYVENFKQRYATLINVCVNNRLERKYNLSQHAYSEIEYCTTQDQLVSDLRKTPSLVTIAFYVTVLTLFGLSVGVNVLDWFGSDQHRAHIVVSLFSIRRNWTRLTQRPNSEIYLDLSYLDGLRVFTTILMVSAHIIMSFSSIPTSNPEYSEMFAKRPLVIDFMVFATSSVQLCFMMGGFLLTATVLKDLKRNPQLEDGYVRNKICSRLIRIVPVYYFCLLAFLMGDDLPGVQLGPVGYKSLIQEQGRCREKWWTSVLFLNNFVAFGEERCNVYGWFLSSDLQLFLAALLLLLVLAKYPKQSKAILWTAAIISLIIPTGIEYYLGLESAIPFTLRDLQYMFMYQPWANYVYFPSYANINNYLAGVIVGYLYHQTKHHNMNLDNSMLYGAIKKLCIPFLAAAYLPAYVFYQQEIPRPSWITVVHSFLYHNATVIAASVFFIEGFRKPPGRIRSILNSTTLTGLGRLSFCVYVLHYTVIRLILNRISPGFRLDTLNALWITMSLTTLFYLVGLVAFFIIEQPLGLLLYHWCIGWNRKKIKVS